MAIARRIVRAYCTPRGKDMAMMDQELVSKTDWATTVPEGDVWTPIEVERSVPVRKSKKKTTKKTPTKNPINANTPFHGDRVLRQACDLLDDALTLREISYAVAGGNPGRAYECLKVPVLEMQCDTQSD